jgi:4-hydroxy-tetrahydrodipicolinate synthase
MAGRFGSVITAMVTPFDAKGALDVNGAQELTRWLLEHGSDGLVVAGTTGEGPTLTDDEKERLFRAVVEAAGGTGKVIANTGTYSTAHSIELSEMAERAGVDALLLVTPYYNRPPQRALLAHFRTIAQATELPIVLYNIPSRTATKIEVDTLLQLAEVPNIVGVKDATSDFRDAVRIVAETPTDFDLYSGDDASTFSYCCLGGVGVVAVASHVAGERLRDMIELVTAGDVAGGRKVNEELEPVYKAMSVTTNPIPVKAALGVVGRPVGDPRLPLLPATAEERATVERLLHEAGVT